MDKELLSKDFVGSRGKIKKENIFNINNFLCEELRELLNDGLFDFVDELKDGEECGYSKSFDNV